MWLAWTISFVHSVFSFTNVDLYGRALLQKPVDNLGHQWNF
jgi:hypothetical protein